MIGSVDSTALPASAQIMHCKESPGAAYLTGLEKGIEEGSKHVPAEFLIEAGPLVAVNIGSVDGKPHAFFCEFCRPRSAPQSVAVAGIQRAYCCPCEPQM